MDIEIEAIRTMIHEMKNSLAALVIQSEIVKDQLPTNVQNDFSLMNQEIKRLTSLANNMSDFIKNPMGIPKDIELVSFISDIAKLFFKSIKINSTLEEAHVTFDPDRARSVFENLIKNACESSTEQDPQVEVSIIKDDTWYVVLVMDRGVGIREEDKDKIFDPCYTTKPHGSGVGLSVSRQFVQAQGGTIKLYSRDGGGTVAEVRLKKER